MNKMHVHTIASLPFCAHARTHLPRTSRHQYTNERIAKQAQTHLYFLYQVAPFFYSFRWLTLLLSQEFELPDVLRLWDSFFADKDRFQFHSYCCCAMLCNIRQQILGT